MLSWRRDIAFIEEEGETLEEGKKYKRYLLLSPLILVVLALLRSAFFLRTCFFSGLRGNCSMSGTKDVGTMFRPALLFLCFDFLTSTV